MQQLYDYFWNHVLRNKNGSRGIKQKHTSITLVPVKKKPKKSPVLAYQKLYADKCRKYAREKWQCFLEDLPPHHPRPSSRPVGFYNQAIRELLASEPPEVHAEIEQYREEDEKANLAEYHAAMSHVEDQVLLAQGDAEDIHAKRWAMLRKRAQ